MPWRCHSREPAEVALWAGLAVMMLARAGVLPTCAPPRGYVAPGLSEALGQGEARFPSTFRKLGLSVHLSVRLSGMHAHLGKLRSFRIIRQ